MGKYFGTDGFRGEANKGLTADHAYKIGRFLGWYYSLNGKKAKGFLCVAFGFAIAAILHSAADSMIFVAGTSIPKIFHVIVIVSGILFVVDQYKKMKHRTTHGVR